MTCDQVAEPGRPRSSPHPHSSPPSEREAESAGRLLGPCTVHLVLEDGCCDCGGPVPLWPDTLVASTCVTPASPQVGGHMGTASWGRWTGAASTVGP